MSFWYGLGFNDLANMPVASIEIYMQQLPARLAELSLLLADTTMLPHAKEDARRNALTKWQRVVNMKSQVNAKPASPAVLKMMGIGVEHVR
jgi:hypothetical protein